MSRSASQPESNTKKSLIAASLTAAFATALTALLILTIPQRADACRDCPFPMKIAEGRWLMPNRQLEVEIHEIDLPGSLTLTSMEVRNAQTGEVLATGSVRLRKGRRTIDIEMTDSEGRPVKAQIYWVDNSRQRVRIFLACEGQCSLNAFLD